MEYHVKVNETKEAAVKQLKEEFGQYSGFIFADYRGLTVAQISDLRKQLRAKDAVCRVVKNRYAKIAMKELGHEGVDDKLVGPTAIVLAKGDEQSAIAKIVVDAQKGTDNKLKVRGGFLDGRAFDAAEVDAFVTPNFSSIALMRSATSITVMFAIDSRISSLVAILSSPL